MNRRVLLGVDVGTTTVKVVATDADFGVVANSISSTLAMDTGRSGRSEESPSQILDCVIEAIGEVCRQLPDDMDPAGIAVGSQSGSIVGLDQSGSPIGPLITWMDSRSTSIVEGWLSTSTGDLIRSISGWNPGPGLGLSTLAWVSASSPVTRPGAITWVGADTLVTSFLTGRTTTNPSNAAAMQLMDVPQGDWSPELCLLADVSPRQLPTLTDSGEIIGPITASAATACGLPPNLLVVAGGHDQTCAAFALNVIEPGHVLLGSGTAWVVTVVAEAVTFDAIPARFNVSPHVIPGRITASEYLGGLGADFESWVGATYGSTTGDRPDRQEMFARAEADIAASHRRGRAATKIMKRAAVRVNDSLEQLAESGTKPSRITLIGGAAASSVWPTIISDITGLPVTIHGDSSWPALGAARLAGIGLGIYDPPRHDQASPPAQETSP